MMPLPVDPRDRKRIVLGVASKAKGDRIADRNPGRQADAVIGFAVRRNNPAAAFCEYPGSSGGMASTSPAAALPKPQATIKTAAIHIR
jgi:hypothetical protein